MTLLLSCQDGSKGYGSQSLFNHLSFGIFQGNKIGLIGPNGAGKSTLLKILARIDHLDTGEVTCRKSLKIGYVPQSSEYPDVKIETIVLDDFHEGASLSLHEKETAVRIILSKLGFKEPSQIASSLSGGWKKRLDIARVLINSPDLILLDEPTNHLDIEGIVWLEKFLKIEPLTFVVTSHDRYFLQNVATQIMELSPQYPNNIFCVQGTYEEFVEKRLEFVRYQLQSERALSNKVRSEVEWLRQSPKARTTKSTARVNQAGELIDQLTDVKNRNRQPKATIAFDASDRQTQKLAVLKNVSKSQGRLLFSHVNVTIAPGTRLGIVGPNGCGKTTLLKLIAGEIVPDSGTIKYAADLKVVHFDQHRQNINLQDTLRQALSQNNDTVTFQGKNIHVHSWAKRFLFSPDRLDLPVGQLSGGERARIGIARLMLQPADLLLLDEPTNDLDIPTLETLEESLQEFPGAIVLITHDRALLDRLTNQVIGLGIPEQTPLLADYVQWNDFLKNYQETQNSTVKKSIPSPSPVNRTEPKAKKLSYLEKKELDEMEGKITETEKKIAILESKIKSCTSAELHALCQGLEEATQELNRCFTRWQELEDKKNSL